LPPNAIHSGRNDGKGRNFEAVSGLGHSETIARAPDVLLAQDEINATDLARTLIDAMGSAVVYACRVFFPGEATGSPRSLTSRERVINVDA
jgi:hypothetical protein